MDTGVLVALGVAAIVIVLAIVATRLLWRPGRDANDRNAADGDAAAMWEGIRQARDRED